MRGMQRSARSRVAPFRVMSLLAHAQARAAAGLPVANLTVGQPGMGAPTPVREAAAKALSDPLGYTPVLGLPELRESIAGHYARSGVSVDPAQIAVTTGSSGGFLLAFLAAFDAGDRVALGRPGYPAYRNILASLGHEVLELPCTAETRFQPTAPMLRDLPEPPAGIVVASPANPTGTMLGAPELANLIDYCAEHGSTLISDEIYHGLTYDHDGVSAWSPAVADLLGDDRARSSSIIVNSFSKYFGMTGWRLGWLILPEQLTEAVEALAGNLALCPPAISQYAALAAFTDRSYEECEAAIDGYRANRRLLLDRLPAMGISRLAPADGAFYIYADLSDITDDTPAWCDRLLTDTGVVVAPGLDFDPIDGERFIRLSFAGPHDDIVRALDWLEPWLSDHAH